MLKLTIPPGAVKKTRSQHPGPIRPLSDGQRACERMHATLPGGGGGTHYLLAGCPCSCPLAEALRVPLPTTGPGEPADPRSASSVDDSVELEVLESSPAPSRRRAAPPGQAGLLPAELPDGLERVSTRWTSAAVLLL